MLIAITTGNPSYVELVAQLLVARGGAKILRGLKNVDPPLIKVPHHSYKITGFACITDAQVVMVLPTEVEQAAVCYESEDPYLVNFSVDTENLHMEVFSRSALTELQKMLKFSPDKIKMLNWEHFIVRI